MIKKYGGASKEFQISTLKHIRLSKKHHYKKTQCAQSVENSSWKKVMHYVKSIDPMKKSVCVTLGVRQILDSILVVIWKLDLRQENLKHDKGKSNH